MDTVVIKLETSRDVGINNGVRRPPIRTAPPSDGRVMFHDFLDF